MDFAQFLRLADSWKVFLVEIEPGHEIESLVWTQHRTYTNLWYTPYTHGVVSRVTQDGEEYVEAFSLSECNGTSKMFYYDYDNQVLYLHTAASDSPGTQTSPPEYDYVVLAYFWRFFTNVQYEDSPIVFPRVQESIVDGGLELWSSSTNLTYWTENISGSSTVNREQTEAYDGAFCAKLSIDSSDHYAEIQQNIRLVPGATAKLSLWYKNSTTGKTAGIVLCDSGQNTYLKSDGTWQASSNVIVLPNATTWTKYEISFTVPGSYTNYHLYLKRNSAASSDIYFDKVSLLVEREKNLYLPYISTAGMPELHQSVSPFHETTMTMEFGQVQMINDGWWWSQIKDYYWHMKNVVIRFGSKGASWSEFQDVFHGFSRSPKATDLLVSIDVIDSKVFAYKNVPPLKYDVDTYPYLEDGAEGTAIPVIYGEFSEVVPTCIDITSYKYKVACHALEAITNVWKNGELLTPTTHYTTDLTNGEFTLTSNPGEAFITCGVKGRKCSILDGTYSENVADILYDVLVTYANVSPLQIDLRSFLDLRGARSQKHHLYLNTEMPALEVARILQQSALFHLVPLLDGRLGTLRYTEGTSSDTPVVTSDEISGFSVEYDTDAVYQTVKFLYGLIPSEGHYSSVERSSDEAKWKHGVSDTYEVKTSLRLKTDAEDLADYYVNVLKDPVQKISGVLPPRLFTLSPGSQVIISRTRLLSDGTTYDVLSSEPLRVLDLKKKMQSGLVEVVAWKELQAAGSSFCENCYHCEVCVSAESGTCNSCYACELCVSGQCSSCQLCYYCQLCNTSQCSSCQVCNTCQTCDTCEAAQCQVCVTCQKCNTSQCTTCQDCVSCQKCYVCERCYTGMGV
jgi:hypothetical protein